EKPNIPANQQIINRSKFANNLFAALFENNTYVQNVIKRYEHESNKAYGLRQRQKRKEKAEAKERQRINDKKNAINTVVIKMQPDQEAKIEGKRIRQRIREIHAQIIIIDNQR
nr:hypothetical protein [Candidatus Enterousia merdequi]